MLKYSGHHLKDMEEKLIYWEIEDFTKGIGEEINE